jgi:hypothetical protein
MQTSELDAQGERREERAGRDLFLIRCGTAAGLELREARPRVAKPGITTQREVARGHDDARAHADDGAEAGRPRGGARKTAVPKRGAVVFQGRDSYLASALQEKFVHVSE